MKVMGKWLCVAGVLAIGTTALAQEGRQKTWWGFDIGFYHPTSSEISDRFGDALFRVGIRPFENRISENWKFAVDFTVLTARKDGDRMLAIPLTFGFKRSFGKAGDSTIPFVQFGVGPAYYDYSITRDVAIETNGPPATERIKDSRWGGNANLEAGLVFNNRFSVSVRGDWYTKADDFDFSGVSVSFSYAAFKW